ASPDARQHRFRVSLRRPTATKPIALATLPLKARRRANEAGTGPTIRPMAPPFAEPPGPAAKPRDPSAGPAILDAAGLAIDRWFAPANRCVPGLPPHRRLLHRRAGN